jgi:HK97 family phage prohead protease
MQRQHEGKPYDVIVGKLKGDDAMTEQSFRYPKDNWTAKDARAHCKSHGGILFEPAGESKGQNMTCENEDTLRDTEGRAVWTTAYINDLADGCFLYIAPGGKKDSGGKTTPRALRHFPYKDASGQIDLPHLRNALARIPQSSLSQSLKDELTAKAKKILADATGKKSNEPEGLERRWVTFEEADVRLAGDGTPKLIGYGAVFDSPTNIGWFEEQVARGAFSETILQDDIRGLFNHDPNMILGRNKAKPTPTMRIFEDSKGLRYEIDVADTQVGRDTLTSVRRGDVSGCSFSFQTIKDEWDRSNPDHPKRTLRKVRLFDVGPVTFPAYPDTSVAARSLEEFKAARQSETNCPEIPENKPPEDQKPAPEGQKRAENAPESAQNAPKTGQEAPKPLDPRATQLSLDRQQREYQRKYEKLGRIIERNRPKAD